MGGYPGGQQIKKGVCCRVGARWFMRAVRKPQTTEPTEVFNSRYISTAYNIILFLKANVPLPSYLYSQVTGHVCYSKNTDATTLHKQQLSLKVSLIVCAK